MNLGPFAIPGYYVGDCRALMRELPDDCIDCVVTSPPYWGLRSYLPEGHPSKALELGCERTYPEYVAHMVEVFREVRRVLKPEGTLWLNLGDCYATGAGAVGECPGGGAQGARWTGEDPRGYRGERLANGRGDQPAVLRKKTVGRGVHTADNSGKAAPRLAAMGPMTQPNRLPQPGLKPKDLVGIPWRVAFALQADGWWLRSETIWAKPNSMPESVTDRPTKAHEQLFLLSRSETYFYDADAIAEEAAAESADRYRYSFGGEKAVALTAQEADGPGTRTHPIGTRDFDGKRNRRTVWTIPTEPTSDYVFDFQNADYVDDHGIPRKLSPNCPVHGRAQRPQRECLEVFGCGGQEDAPVPRSHGSDDGRGPKPAPGSSPSADCRAMPPTGNQRSLQQADRHSSRTPGASPDVAASRKLPNSESTQTSHGTMKDCAVPEGSAIASGSSRRSRKMARASIPASRDTTSVESSRRRPHSEAPPCDSETFGRTVANRNVEPQLALYGLPTDSVSSVCHSSRTETQNEACIDATCACAISQVAHFATMPTKLVQPCILAGCPAGGITLDPFGGSGTVARVAEDNGRQWLMFDLSSDYAQIAKRKTAQTGLLGRCAQ